MPIKLTEQEIEGAKSDRGGWTRDTLSKWGVPWPPPHGWRKALLRGEAIPGVEPKPKELTNAELTAKVEELERRIARLEQQQ